MHFSIRHYELNVEKLDNELIARIKNEFVPILKEIPGFHAYRIIDSGDHEIATMTAFETKEGAVASVEKAREWVDANFSDLVKERISAISGEQIFSELA